MFEDPSMHSRFTSILKSVQSDPSMLDNLVSLVETQRQLWMEDEEKCDFDLCSSCAEKEEVENVCPRSHQLHPVQLSGDSIYSWSCDGCGYQASPEEMLDCVQVWRCEKDRRNPPGRLFVLYKSLQVFIMFGVFQSRRQSHVSCGDWWS